MEYGQELSGFLFQSHVVLAMSVEYLQEILNFSFATPGTGEDCEIWPRIVLLPYSVSVSLHLVLANPVEYGLELSCFLIQCQFRYTRYWRTQWNMAKNCLASLFSVSFATPGTGEPSGIWPRIVLLPSVSVSLHLVLAKTMEYIQELACILVQRWFRYMLHWQRPRYMAGTGHRGVSLYTCPGAQPGGWGSVCVGGGEG